MLATRLKEQKLLKDNWAEKIRAHLHSYAESVGNLLVEAFHYLALFVIGGITAWAAVLTVLEMLGKGAASIDDILLLFIYLELGAMVGIYFKTNHMPVRFFNLCRYYSTNALDDFRHIPSSSSRHGRCLRIWRYSTAGIFCLSCALRFGKFSCSQTQH